MSLARMASQSQLDFELNFFESILKRHPNYVEMLRCHAKNLAAVKRYSESAMLDRRIIQLCPTDSLAYYNLACLYSLMHKVELAIHSLRRALELGYDDFDFIKKDRDLDTIRQDPRYRQLIREYQSR